MTPIRGQTHGVELSTIFKLDTQLGGRGWRTTVLVVRVTVTMIATVKQSRCKHGHCNGHTALDLVQISVQIVRPGFRAKKTISSHLNYNPEDNVLAPCYHTLFDLSGYKYTCTGILNCGTTITTLVLHAWYKGGTQ
eukprot:2521668-Rhodomonas_salina.1